MPRRRRRYVPGKRPRHPETARILWRRHVAGRSALAGVLLAHRRLSAGGEVAGARFRSEIRTMSPGLTAHKDFSAFFFISSISRPPPTPRQPSARQYPGQAGRRVPLQPTTTVPMVSKAQIPLRLFFRDAFVAGFLHFFRKKPAPFPAEQKRRVCPGLQLQKSLSHHPETPTPPAPRGSREEGRPSPARQRLCCAVLRLVLLRLSGLFLLRAPWVLISKIEIQPSREEEREAWGGIPPKLLSNFLKNGEGCAERKPKCHVCGIAET